MVVVVVVVVAQSIGKRGPISDQDRADHLAHLGRPICFWGGKIASKLAWTKIGGSKIACAILKNAIAKPKCGTGANLDLAILQEVVVVVAVVVVAVAVVEVAAVVVVVVGASPTNQVYGVTETSSGDSSGNSRA